MTGPERTPVLVGVAQVDQRDGGRAGLLSAGVTATRAVDDKALLSIELSSFAPESW